MADRYQNRVDPDHDRQVSNYYDEIIALALLFINGDLTRAEYTAAHIELTETALINGVILAGGIVTAPEVLAALAEQQVITQESTRQLADDIENGRYSANDMQTDEEGQEKLRNRLALWTFTIGGAYVAGQLSRPPQPVNIDGEIVTLEPVYRWVLGPTEHCDDCLLLSKFDPMPMSEWKRYPPPRSPDLECGGWRCQCDLEEVPITQGVP